ncbi:MvaI/BcnI family restriction endonuclease [Candidatus Endomicrobiellum pyrsonymphae]
METLLGVTENNIANPDIEGTELKAYRRFNLRYLRSIIKHGKCHLWKQ